LDAYLGGISVSFFREPIAQRRCGGARKRVAQRYSIYFSFLSFITSFQLIE
jgi:hypothetical protein